MPVSSPATVLLRRARIYSLADNDLREPAPIAHEALAVRHGRIIAVGSESSVASAAPEGSPAVDLAGRAVLPGFTDGHAHWANHALQRRWLRLEPDHSLADVVRLVRGSLASPNHGDWVVGRGWDHTAWGRWPTAADLDAVAPDMPVALIRKDGHALWANTAALRAAGIEPTTPDPAGGEIVHDNGALSGILKETAVSLVRRAIPAPEPAERQAALVDSWPDAWARGITGCHDMGYMAGTLFRDLATLRDAGELGLRFVWYFQKDALDEAIGLGLRSGFGDEWLRIGGLKLFLDGTLGSQTAHLVEPYTGLPDHRGVEVLGREELVDLLHRAVDARLAVALHAIGDAAVKKALDGLAALPLEDGHGPLRHRIEHVQLVDPDDIPRFARHRVTASVQPIHLVADALLADRYWGERASHAYPWRSLRDSGATLVFGSDVPVESPDTFAGIHTAVNRAAGRQGRPWHPEQAVSVTDALRAYTAGPAWAAGQDETLGTLEAGKRADLIVVEPDPFSVAPQHLDEVRVLATMIDGVWVWQGPDAELAGPRG